MGAGDIAGCANIEGAEATAKLIKEIPGTVYAAGDVVYERGTAEEFKNCYEPTWGQFKDRTRPSIGITSMERRARHRISRIGETKLDLSAKAITATTWRVAHRGVEYELQSAGAGGVATWVRRRKCG